MNTVDSKLATTLQDLNLNKVDETRNRNDLGQDDFLKLMVTQLRNQDPFSPLENGDFIAQMAQFSSVSGLNELQNSFKQLATSLQSNQALQASTLVGRSVLVPSSSGFLKDTGTVDGVITLPGSSSNVYINVEDAKGQVVRRVGLGSQSAGDIPFSWDGRTNDGDRAPSGQYKITAEAQASDKFVSLETFVNAAVESVTLNSGIGGLTLNLTDLGSMPFSQVREIR